jgi:hypothetical protein
MDLVDEKMRRLDSRGPASRGVVVDAEGAMLGPDCVLVRRTAAGYRCLHPAEAAAIQKAAFGSQVDQLSVKGSMSGQLPRVRKCWTADDKSDKLSAGRKDGHENL